MLPSSAAANHSPDPANRSTTHRSRAVHFGWVSLLQDLGSKMVVPALPLFLTLQLGASAFVVGLIDGVGAVSAAVVAPVAGRIASRAPVRLVRLGYGLSSVMKLALAAATAWPAVLAVRVADRAGKGVRDAPRDLLLANSPSERHGRTFGIQQAMDKTGGFLGPLIGIAVYSLFDSSFDAVFIVAFVPCALSVALLWRIPDAPNPAREAAPTTTSTLDAANATPSQRRALIAVGLHSLGFVSVSLLLVRALDVDASVARVLLAYSGLRLVTALTSYPAGRLVDRHSAQSVTVAGMVVAAASIGLAAVASNVATIAIALGGVGLAEAFTKAPVKAWLVSLGPPASHGAVLGDRSAVAGAAALIGSIAVGAAWNVAGQAPLLAAAAIGLLGAAVASTVRSPTRE